MSKYHKAETIPERGNVSFIDAASWRALIVEGGGIPKGNIWRAVLGLCIWQYAGRDKESIADELELDEMLRKEMFLAIERQERFNKSSQARQLQAKYRGFKTNLKRKCANDELNITAPTFEDWIVAGSLDVDEFIARALNGEIGEC